MTGSGPIGRKVSAQIHRPGEHGLRHLIVSTRSVVWQLLEPPSAAQATPQVRDPVRNDATT
jgi:hypothetical protein